MMMGQESQQDNSRNQGMEINSLVNGEAENAMPNTADENFPVQMNGHYSRNVNVDLSVNNGIPQSFGGNMHAMGTGNSGMNPNIPNAMMTQSVMNSGGMNMMGTNLPVMNSTAMNMTGQGVPGMNSMGRTMTPMNSMGMNIGGVVPLMNANIPPSMFMQTVNFDSSQNQEEMNRTMGK
jgi:hypothetical protein